MEKIIGQEYLKVSANNAEQVNEILNNYCDVQLRLIQEQTAADILKKSVGFACAVGIIGLATLSILSILDTKKKKNEKKDPK